MSVYQPCHSSSVHLQQCLCSEVNLCHHFSDSQTNLHRAQRQMPSVLGIHFVFQLIFCHYILIVGGSAGDIDYYYQRCVQHCVFTTPSRETKLSCYESFLVNVMQWDDVSSCQYECMRNISDEREKEGMPVLKYYGHWPYHRVLGLQEPASALFSFCNAIPHLYYLSTKAHMFAESLRIWIVLYGTIATVAWLCSTLFHARKVTLTIAMDYMSALAFLMFGLFVALRRTLHFYIFKSRPLLVSAVFASLVMTCGMRLRAMYHDTVSFDSHMNFSILVAVTHTTVWIVWILIPTREDNRHKLSCLILQVWFIAASMLELFDFPPVLHHFDAHSLWHMATIPLGFLWYRFWLNDAVVLQQLENSKKID